MKTKQLLLTGLVTLAMGTGGIAYANSDNGYGYGKHQGQKRTGMRNHSPEQKVEKMAKRLGLSHNQKQQVQSLMTENKAKMQPLREKMRHLKSSLRNLDPSSYDFSSQLNNLADQQANLIRQITIAKGQNRQQLFTILSPEQQTKMKAMKDKRMQKRQGRRGERHNY